MTMYILYGHAPLSTQLKIMSFSLCFHSNIITAAQRHYYSAPCSLRTQHAFHSFRHGQNLSRQSNRKPASSLAKLETQMSTMGNDIEVEQCWKDMERLGEDEEGMVELMECLQRKALIGDDEGINPSDYNRRAHIFHKCSKVFQALKNKQSKLKLYE